MIRAAHRQALGDRNLSTDLPHDYCVTISSGAPFRRLSGWVAATFPGAMAVIEVTAAPKERVSQDFLDDLDRLQASLAGRPSRRLRQPLESQHAGRRESF